MLKRPYILHFRVRIIKLSKSLHSNGHTALTWTCNMDMDMDMQHGFGHAAWIWTRDMHGCRNAGMPIKSSVWHCWFSVRLQRLVQHRHSTIMVSPVPLVKD